MIVVNVEEGLSKPYKDSNGTIYLKNGSDKWRVTSNDEIARLLGSKSLFADEMEIYDMLYSGLGSGIRRAIKEQPDLELENDVEGEQFIARFPRRI